MHTRRALSVTTLLFSALACTACGARSSKASDGDTGAAAPATTRDMSATPSVADTAAARATPAAGQAQTAGDTAAKNTRAGGMRSRRPGNRNP